MKKNPYAVAAFVMGILSFIQLFGLEKAFVAGIFGLLALGEIKKESGQNQNISLLKSSKVFAITGIALASLYILSVGLLFYFKSAEIANVIHKIK